MQYNKENRLFYISNDIDNGEIGSICTELLNVLAEDDKKDKKEKKYKRKPIKIYIQSFGGCIYDMWTLIDIMLNSKTPIYTYCTGYAMSAGFKIFLAGHRRFMSKHAVLMYHQVSDLFGGKYKDIKEKMEDLTLVQKEIEEYVKNRSKVSQKKLNHIKKTKKDWYIRLEEALEYGFATDILGEK